MIAVIGGKADGHTVPAKVQRLELDGETYMLVSYRESGGKEEFFYLLAGTTPAAAMKVFKERYGKA